MRASTTSDIVQSRNGGPASGVAMFHMFLRMGGWLALLPLFVIVVSALNYRSASADAARLRSHGVDGIATITGRLEERRTFVPGVSDNPESRYILRFRYSSGSVLAGNFKAHLGEQPVSRALYEKLAVGETTPIRFLPGNDSVFEIEPGALVAKGSNAGMIGLVIGVICLPLFVIVWRNAARAVRLRRTGVVAEGRVERFQHRGVIATLDFSYSDDRGMRHQGRTLPRRLRGYGTLAAGAALRVVYDPADPGRAFWVDDLGLTQESPHEMGARTAADEH